MSSLQMPKVDNSIMSKKDKIALDLRRIINSKKPIIISTGMSSLEEITNDGLWNFSFSRLATIPKTPKCQLSLETKIEVG